MRRGLACLGVALAVLAAWRSFADADAETATKARAAVPVTAAPALASDKAEALYDRFCVACHGAAGDGKGPAQPWLWPKPTDFTTGLFKWRTTADGSPPSDEDLARAILHGTTGSSMPGFSVSLNRGHVQELIGKIKSFAPEHFASAPTMMARATEALPASLSVERGQAVWQRLGCAECHGERGQALKGQSEGNYDLGSQGLRRPHALGEDTRPLIYLSLLTGLSGTAMKSYADQASSDELWDLAAYVDGLLLHPTTREQNRSSVTHPQAIAMDKAGKRLPAGYASFQGHGQEELLFGGSIELHGKAPEVMAPAQGTLSAKQCARCHDKQYQEWRGSMHGAAGSPGLIAQLLPMAAHGQGASLESCQRCHAPLAEQLPLLRAGQRGGDESAREYTSNAFYDADLREQGINCAACHMRGWRRFGPPNPSPSLLRMPNYPVFETEQLYTQLPMYERGDFCQPCHQLPARLAVEGKPLLNTYREWLEGPYMQRGVQCQHCHMPNREHTWKGVHDPDTFRQGIDLDVIAGRSASGTVSVRARLSNVGAGHFLPTTPTPAAFLSIRLLDRDGQPIAGATSEKRIGRHLRYDKGWHEIEDTRIPPGESIELASAWKRGRVGKATHALVSVRVVPDDYYEGFYAKQLAGKLGAEERRLFEEALGEARKRRYVAIERLIPIR